MRYILLATMLISVFFTNKAESYSIYLSDYAPQSAYDARGYRYYKIRKAKRHLPLNKMAYQNPPASQIFNHPAKGMKHPRHEALRLTHGVQQRKILYPYYELRDRSAPVEWFVR